MNDPPIAESAAAGLLNIYLYPTYIHIETVDAIKANAIKMTHFRASIYLIYWDSRRSRDAESCPNGYWIIVVTEHKTKTEKMEVFKSPAIPQG